MKDPKLAKVLSKEQNINIPQIGLIKIHTTELTQQDFGSFTLITTLSCEPEVFNKINELPILERGIFVEGLYEESIVKVEIVAFTKFQFRTDIDAHEIHFVCGVMTGSKSEGETFQFLLPYADFGLGDHKTIRKTDTECYSQVDNISFTVDEITWTWRSLYEVDDVFYTSEKAYDLLTEKNLSINSLLKSSHTVLEVSTNDITSEQAQKTVTNICWLLHLALANSINWSQLKIINSQGSHFLYKQSTTTPKNLKINHPISNHHNGLMKDFVEAAYPIINENIEWWKITLNWYSIAKSHSAIESNAMVYCMLLDRISTKLHDGLEYSKQIGVDLEKSLAVKSNKKKLRKELTAMMLEYASAWDDNRSNKIIEAVTRWNDQPSYPNKIKLTYKLLGLAEPDDLGMDIIQKRHTLLHDGHLKLAPEDALKLHSFYNLNILVLLFSMLKYEGEFFALGTGESSINDFKVDK